MDMTAEDYVHGDLREYKRMKEEVDNEKQNKEERKRKKTEREEAKIQ